MENLIRFLMENFTLTFLILGLIVAAVSLWRQIHSLSPVLVVESLFSYFLLFSIGFSFFYNFIAHVFFGEISAEFIGWAQSPFQAEVGWASLGFSAVGFLAFRGSFGTRAAAVIGPSCFLLGAAAGHIQQMVVASNFAPGNAGIIFYTDIGIPVIGLMLLWIQYRLRRDPSVPKDIASKSARAFPS